MAERITRVDVESAVANLNRAAEELGMERKFQVDFGSAGNGVQHELAEVHPGLSHPTRTKIGPTFALALSYVSAMAHALRSAKLDRDYRRQDAIMMGPAAFIDPDSRSARRSGERF
jgi:hypothetical protein